MDSVLGRISDTLQSQQKTLQMLVESQGLQRQLESSKPSLKENSSALYNATALLGTFEYNPENDMTFDTWFHRNQALLEKTIEDPTLRVRILLKSLGPSQYIRLRGRLSPEQPELKSYEDLLGILNEILGATKSLFHRRHDILTLRDAQGTSAEEILNVANLKGDEFALNELTLETFEIFLVLLMSSDASFKNLRAVILKAIDESPNLSLQELREVIEHRLNRLQRNPGPFH